MSSSADERGKRDSFSWENQTWAMLNSAAATDDADEDKYCIQIHDHHKLQQQPSTTASPTVEDETQLQPLSVVLPPPSLLGKKRERVDDEDRDGSNNKNDNRRKSGGVGVAESDHEIHIWTERERRKKMRNMFAHLHALLPQLPPKADKSTIVDEAVHYIKSLQQTVQKLHKQKLERIQKAANNNNSVSSGFCYESVSSLQQPPLLCETSSREAFLADQGSSNNSNNNNNYNINNRGGGTGSSNFPATIMFQTWTSSNVVLSVCGSEAQISICSVKKPGLFSTICYVLEKHNIDVLSAHLSSDFNRTMFMIQAHANRSGSSSSGGISDEFGEALLMEDTFKQAAAEIIFWLSS